MDDKSKRTSKSRVRFDEPSRWKVQSKNPSISNTPLTPKPILSSLNKKRQSTTPVENGESKITERTNIVK